MEREQHTGVRVRSSENKTGALHAYKIDARQDKRESETMRLSFCLGAYGIVVSTAKEQQQQQGDGEA